MRGEKPAQELKIWGTRDSWLIGGAVFFLVTVGGGGMWAMQPSKDGKTNFDGVYRVVWAKKYDQQERQRMHNGTIRYFEEMKAIADKERPARIRNLIYQEFKKKFPAKFQQPTKHGVKFQQPTKQAR